MDYLYIRAWGRLLGSYQYYIAAEVAQAQQDKAPHDAIFKRGDVWHCWSDINDDNPNKWLVADIVVLFAHLKGGIDD